MSPPTTAPATILRLSIPLVALVAAMGPLRAQDLEVEAPAVILKDIPFSITVRTPQSLDTVRVILRAADGRVLGAANHTRVVQFAPATPRHRACPHRA